MNHAVSDYVRGKMMSGNWRKDVDVYSQSCSPEMDKTEATMFVFRPGSMRKVSAVKELNRLRAHILRLERGVDDEGTI